MEGALSVIALVAVIGSTGTIIIAAHFRKERVAELKTWAREHGWHYVEHHPRPLADATLPPGTTGQQQRSQHVLTGRRGSHQVTAFEHSHAAPSPNGRGSGRIRHTYRIVAVRTPGFGANLEIRRREPAHGAAFDDSVTGLDSAFSGTFQATGNDAELTRTVLDRTLTSWLLADSRSRSLPVRFTGDYVLTWAAMRLDPDRALTAADYLIDLVERLPNEVWKRRAGP